MTRRAYLGLNTRKHPRTGVFSCDCLGSCNITVCAANGKMTGIVVPPRRLVNGVPLRHRALIGKACYTGTPGESRPFYLHYAARYRDIRQTATIVKRRFTNACEALGEREARQAGAAVKRVFGYARETLGERDSGQTGATGKRSLSYARDAVRDRDAC